MDIEREARQQLMRLLSNDFFCSEEVNLRPLSFPKVRIRADVVAIPLDPKFYDMPIAFEVKQPSAGRENHYAEWAPAIKQAADYVYAAIEPDQRLQDFGGRRVIAAFVFPAPELVSDPQGTSDREANAKMITTGAFHAALYFRVGRARIGVGVRSEILNLSMGPKQLWSSDRGWDASASDLMTNKRKLGSQMIDVLAELDGTGRRPDGFPWE